MLPINDCVTYLGYFGPAEDRITCPGVDLAGKDTFAEVPHSEKGPNNRPDQLRGWFSLGRNGSLEWIFAALLLMVFTWWNCFTGLGIKQAVDFRAIYQPVFDFAFDCMRQGVMPWWNPYLGLGRPLMSDVHYGLWYPPTYLLMGGDVGLYLLIWSHLMLLWAGTRRLVMDLDGHQHLASWLDPAI